MSIDIGRALRMPFNQPRWFETILIGGIVWLVASMVSQIPHIGSLANVLILSLTGGYCLKVMREESHATANVPVKLPVWDNWQRLFTDGLLLTVAQTIYGLILFLLFLVVMVALGATAALASLAEGDASQLAPGAVLAMFIFMFVGGLLYAIYMPMMAAHFAHEGRFGAAFEVGTIVTRVFARPLQALLVVAMMLALGVAVLFSAITIILVPFAVFFAQVVTSNLWAQVYKQGASR